MRSTLLTLFTTACGLAVAFPTDPNEAPEFLALPNASPDFPSAYLDTRSADATCYIEAYSGTGCSGSAGHTFAVSPAAGGTCFTPDAGRHSYKFSAACPTLTVSLYRVQQCAGSAPIVTHQGPGCYGFNNQYAVGSLNAAFS